MRRDAAACSEIHDDAEAHGAEGAEEDVAHGVGRRAVDDGGEVGHREDQTERDKHRGDATDVDRHAHGLRDHAARVAHLFGDVTVRLEAVVEVNTEDRRADERDEERRALLEVFGAEVGEEHAEVVLARRDEQPRTDEHGRDDLDHEASERDVREQLRAAEVHERREQDQQQREQYVHRRIHLDAEERPEERTRTVRDRGDRRVDRDHVDPAGDPSPLRAPQAPVPGVDAARDRVLRDDLTEHARDEQLPEARDDEHPEGRRAGNREGCGEGRVDADDRREVGEAEREVPPEPHVALELAIDFQPARFLGRVLLC
jgi:hypothetical protein